MNPLLLAPLLKVGQDVFNRIFPDAEQAANATREFEKELKNLDLEKDKAFRDFVVEYEGAGKDTHPFIQILRGSVRPTLTYTLAGFFLYGFLNPLLVEAETMDLLWKLNLISLSFWYSERALKNLGFNFSKRKEKDNDIA